MADSEDDWPEPARPPHAELRAYLTAARKRLGITQTELAKRISTTQSNVSDLEAGHVADPGIGSFARWAAALDLDLTVEVVERRRHTFVVTARSIPLRL